MTLLTTTSLLVAATAGMLALIAWASRYDRPGENFFVSFFPSCCSTFPSFCSTIGNSLLEPTVPRAVAEPYAVDLGVAFQLSNFIRDVGEDLRRGRVYLPGEDLALFGVDRERLALRVVDGPVRRLLAFEIARTRELYRAAEPGVRLLHPTSRDCIYTAIRLYGGILDEVERADYRVLDRRVAVGPARRARVAVPGLARAFAARRG